MLTRTVAGRTFDYSHAVGGRYIGQPCSLAVGSGNTVYVLLRGGENISNVPWNRTGTGSRVARLSIPETAGDEEFIGEAGSYGDGDGEYIWPTGLALDSQENVYVTDEWMNRITVTDKEGKFICSWGATGTGDGEFDGPAGIAVDADDNLYIVDSRNHRVQKTSKDGKFLAKWGSLGSGTGEFDSPGASASTARATFTWPTTRTTAFRNSPQRASTSRPSAVPARAGARLPAPPTWR